MCVHCMIQHPFHQRTHGEDLSQPSMGRKKKALPLKGNSYTISLTDYDLIIGDGLFILATENQIHSLPLVRL